VATARIASGSTEPGVGWQQHGDGVTLTVDTSSGNFTTTPRYVISLSGPGGNMWISTGGAASVYEPSSNNFKVFILDREKVKLDVNQVTDNYRWYVNWIGIED